MSDTTTPEPPPSEEAPVYAKVTQRCDDGTPSSLYLITCDEGWRTTVLAAGVYGRDADFLLSLLGRTPRLEGAREAAARQPSPELDALREQLAIAATALRDLRDGIPASDFGHDTAHKALDEIGGVKPSPPGEAAQLREQLGRLRERVAAVALAIRTSAAATSPSKKSDIELAVARQLQALLETT